MAIVCIDTNILIWGIKEEANQGQEEMIPRAKSFLKSLENTATKILIPSIVMAEFLMRIPSELHPTITNLFSKNFLVVPFDIAAATQCSKIWRDQKDSTAIKQLVANGSTRAELKADRMIVATALSRSAECIYSHDKTLKIFANGFIQVKDIPFIPKQTEMYSLIRRDIEREGGEATRV